MDRFQILILLDFAMDPPWNEFEPHRARPVVRGIPEVAVIPRGTPVQWLVRNDYGHRYLLHRYPRLFWEIYFVGRSPFPRFSGLLRIRTSSDSPEDSNASHNGSTEPLIAEEEGEFKYGIRVIDAETKELISDEDPWLIVGRA